MRLKMVGGWIATILIAALLAGSAPVVADDEVQGKIVVARSSGDAVVLYDATPEVAAIVRDKLDDAAADKRLQHDALRVLAKVVPDLSAARTITIRVTYARSGDVSPVYGTPTFAGVERYANLKVSTTDAQSDRDKWRERTPDTAALPPWISFAVVGKLPPR